MPISTHHAFGTFSNEVTSALTRGRKRIKVSQRKLLYLFGSLTLGYCIIFVRMLSNFSSHNVVRQMKIVEPMSPNRLAVNVSPDPSSRTILSIDRDRQGAASTNVWIMGTIDNLLGMNPEYYAQFTALSCQLKIGIFIITANGQTGFRRNFNLPQSERDAARIKSEVVANTCAPIVVRTEGELGIEFEDTENSIGRISRIRDYQRNVIKEEFQQNDIMDENKGVVIVMDFDVLQIPTSTMFKIQISDLLKPKIEYPHDAICANGMETVEKDDARKESYSDTMATVFLPDTFLVKPKDRFMFQNYPGEDQLITSMSPDEIGPFLTMMGSMSKSGSVPVKSCFGGMTLYRANVFLGAPQCKYQLESSGKMTVEMLKYATKLHERPSEHVVFHSCMNSNWDDFDIAINPEIITKHERK